VTAGATNAISESPAPESATAPGDTVVHELNDPQAPQDH
jgi:hypothetical protein